LKFQRSSPHVSGLAGDGINGFPDFGQQLLPGGVNAIDAGLAG
jgi:hypothetical protein